MRWSVVTVVAVLAVAGCETSSSLLADAPTKAYDISADASVVRDCIVAASPGTFSVTPYKQGWLVAPLQTGDDNSNFGPAVSWLVEIDGTASGTHVAVHEAFGPQFDYKLLVQPCLEKAGHT